MPSDDILDVTDQIKKKDRRVLAKTISKIENDPKWARQCMAEFAAFPKKSTVVGITGAPGSGKSTIINALIAHIRAQDKTVGVIAVDPTSPFSGGAVLGDRVRMENHTLDAGVFIRSFGQRGAEHGLAMTTRHMMYLYNAYGFDYILVESVGVGQNEHTIQQIADVSIVILVPESGDTIQLMKAGILEIADIFVANKSDRDGASFLVHSLKELSGITAGSRPDHAWRIPVVQTVAVNDQGMPELFEYIRRFKDSVDISRFKCDSVQNVSAILSDELVRLVPRWIAHWLRTHPTKPPYDAVEPLLEKIEEIFHS